MPKTRVTHDDDELVLRDVLARDAARAAGMLDTAAAVLLAVVTLLAVAGVAVGLGVLAVAHTSTGRIDAAITIAGSAVGWLFSIFPYLAAHAVASYIRFRTQP